MIEVLLYILILEFSGNRPPVVVDRFKSAETCEAARAEVKKADRLQGSYCIPAKVVR